MVIPISNSGAAKVDAQRILTAPIILVEDKRGRKVEGNGTPAARFARLGPPIDVNRVNEIRAAIAGGRHRRRPRSILRSTAPTRASSNFHASGFAVRYSMCARLVRGVKIPSWRGQQPTFSVVSSWRSNASKI
jgi:hypothetical protein